MATLTDKYVNALVAANDARNAQRQAEVQKQYDAWAKKQRKPISVEQTIEPVETEVQQEIPSLKTIRGGAEFETAQAEKPNRFAKLNDTISQIKQTLNDVKEKAIPQVVMDENGMADIDSVKRNARATTAQRKADATEKKQNTTKTAGDYPQAKYTADGKLDVAALQNDPKVREMTATQTIDKPNETTKNTTVSDKINYYADKWLDPNYKMTNRDKEIYNELLEEWASGDTSDWNNTDRKKLNSIGVKANTLMSAAAGIEDSLSGLVNLGALIGKALGNDETDAKIDKYLAQRNSDIQNAYSQHGAATNVGKVVGMGAQYAATNALLGALSGGKLATESIVDAYRANKSLGAAGKTFGTNIAKQLIPDLLVDTSSNVINNVASGADAGTIARDAAENILENAAYNALFELPGLSKATFEAGKDLAGLDKQIASLGNVTDAVRKANIPSLAENIPARQIADDVEDVVRNVPSRQIADQTDDIVKAVEDATARQAVEDAQKTVKEAVRENAESIFRKNPVTGDMSSNGNAVMRRVTELGNELENNPEAVKIWEQYVEEIEKANAGQENALRAVSNEFADALGTDTARKNIDEVYNLVIGNEMPKTFSGATVEELNPLFKLMDETVLDDVKYAPVEVRNSIEDVLYKNMDAIQKNETLKNKVVEVEEAYDKWVEAIYSGVGDTTRLGKDVQNAVNRLNTALKKEGMDQVKVNWQTYTRPDYLMNQVKPEGYVAPTAKSVAESVEPEAKLTIEPTKTETAKVSPINTEEAETLERSYARNIREGRVDASEEVKQAFENEPRTYQRISNKATSESVDEIMKQGEDFAREQYELMKGTNDARFAPLGQKIARQLSDAGKHNEAAAVLDEVAEELTKAGQMTQAAYITMLKDDPMTALASVQKQIKKINEEGAKKYGKNWKDFELTDDEIKAFTDLKPGDEKGLQEAVDTLSARLGADYPTTFMDKLLEARKISMLLNPRTNIRNVVANIPTLGMRWVSDRISAIGERGYKALVNKDFNVTQSVGGPSKESKKLADEIFKSDEVQNLLKDTPGKYEVPDIKSGLINNKTMYKGTAVSRFLENAGVDIQGLNKKLFGKDNVHSLAETTRNLNYKLLDMGDSPFVRRNFVDRLGSYIDANNIKDIADVPKKAIDLAWLEAMKATYKDNSWAVQMISGIKKGIEQIPGVGRPISQAVIPFVQAPGNIAARMVDYSAIGGANGIKNIIKGTKKADEKMVREGIDQLSKGLTGTGMVMLGVALHNSGIITGAYSKDKDQRNFQKQTGYKEYALHVGDKYYTYDWAQPVAQNLILGTLLAEAIQNSDQYDSDVLKHFGIEGSTAGKVIGGAKEGATASINSWFNESPMQGLAELLRNKAGGYDADIAGNLWDVAVSDFASSFIPSVVNASAKTTDTTQRQTTDNTNTFTTFVNQQMAKIPGLSDELPAKYDTWGREMKYGDTKADAAFARFINPGDTGTDKHDPLDDEINRLYEATKDVAVFPTTAPTSANGKKLTAQEYSDYQKDMGERSHEMVESLVKSDLYKSMSNDEKVKALSDIYSASKALTENKLYDKEIKSNGLAKAYQENGSKGVIQYMESKNALDQYGFSDSSKAGEAVKESKNPEKTAKELSEVTKTLQSAGLIDRKDTQPPAEVVKIYQESGVRGVNDYVTVETNEKGGNYNGYQNLKQYIPHLTAKEYANIYNTFSVPTKTGNYDNSFAKDTELIPYLTSRTWDSDEQLNQVAHALSPSVQGTWHIGSNGLYYNKPSVETWNGATENEAINNVVNMFR